MLKCDPDWRLVPIRRGQRLLRNVLYLLYGTRGMICGGFARWLASPNPSPVPFGDIDIFCQNVEDYDRTKAQLLAHGLTPDFETEIAITFQPYRLGWFQKYKLQLIKPVREDQVVTYGTLQEILANFDFSVIRVGVVNQFQVMADPYFEQDEKHKFLRLQKISCPLGQSIRIAKYQQKGYLCLPSLYLQVFKAWDGLTQADKQKVESTLEVDQASSKALELKLDFSEKIKTDPYVRYSKWRQKKVFDDWTDW